jgi:phage terminase large subunit GpA-like protein
MIDTIILDESEILVKQLKNIVTKNIPQISTIKPSDWVEQNIVMGKPFPGPFRYKRTPYTREIIDILSPDSSCWGCAVKKGGQIGFSAGVIYPGICWIIKNNPGNTSLSVGAPELIKKATDKLDACINSAGLRDYIKPSSLRKRNNKTGDTNTQKDFTGGFAMIWSANNHKNIRQVDLQNQFNDDYVAIKKASKESGSTDKKLDQRSAAYKDTKKRMDISTPELIGSTIDEAFDKGDKRRYLIPCPCCNDLITIDWIMPSVCRPGKMAGITWKMKEGDGGLDKESVGYVCPLCDGFFTDKNKQDWLNKGEWVAFDIQKIEGYRSYHISALYAPIGMDGWDKYVQDWIDIHPKGQPRKEEEYQWFVNEVLGESYEPKTTAIQPRQLEKNIQPYDIGVVPDELSVKHGNGHIVLITCACDLGGRYVGDQLNSKEDDARLDWEIVAHAENGTTYSIDHGSIGTFTNAYLGKKDEGRELWSYDPSKTNNVWKELDLILARTYVVGKHGRGANAITNTMKIQLTGIDSGFADKFVWNYIDSRSGRFKIVGLKGNKESTPRIHGANQRNWTLGKSRANLYMIEVGHLKDIIASRISLRWDGSNASSQPGGYMNFPRRADGKYENENYFEHFEAEHRVIDEKKGTFIWKKKSPNVQNHVFDLNVYNMALTEILMHHVFKEIGVVEKDEQTWWRFSEWLIKQWGLTSALNRPQR